MNQSFNALRRLWWRLRTDPFLFPMVIGYVLLLCAALACSSGVLLGGAVAWVIPIAILPISCPRGHPRFLARVLTPNFYAVKHLGGDWVIFQRRAAKKGEVPDCKQLRKELVVDQIRLPEELTPGRYRALTHDTVLTRLRQMPNAKIVISKPAYMGDMAQIWSTATAKHCKKCKEHCPNQMQRKTMRQFYYVVFEVEHNANLQTQNQLQ